MVFPILHFVANYHLTGACGDPCLHRLPERRPRLDEVVLEQPEFGLLRELAGVLVTRTIAKTKYQMIGNDVALRGFDAYPFADFLAVKAAQRKEPVGETFLLANRHLI